jgi:DNA-directed RNA polymerase omega subunit
MEPLNNFHLASLAFQRVRQLQSGARPRVATNGHKSLYVALEEVEAGLISWEVGAEVRQDGAGIGGSPMVGGKD